MLVDTLNSGAWVSSRTPPLQTGEDQYNCHVAKRVVMPSWSFAL